MEAAVLSTAITTAGLVLVAAVTVWGQRHNAAKIEQTAAKVETKAGVTEQKLEQIHFLVNSRLTEALNEIQALREFIDKQRSVSGVTSDQIVPPVAGPPLAVPGPVLPPDTPTMPVK